MIVLDRPKCKKTNIRYMAVFSDDPIFLHCHVTANPTDVTFYWAQNDSLSEKTIRTDDPDNNLKSVLKYKPDLNRNVDINCKAKNSIGLQETPCIFKLFPAGKLYNY